ncbi:RHS repeat-associated core domain-containing protein [Akkermansia sp. BIOML-A48]|nr:RHS repeat-associated core domain-containing protein [Akkermansia sp. BIOML-A48]
MKKVTVNGTVTSHERYLYRGYLQLAALDMLNRRNVLRTLLWDPLEPMATRPLALVQDNALYCYGVDFNKNVTEVFDGQGTVAAAYDYSPYGQVASTGDLVQPVQWNSEMNDKELELIYCNYCSYNPADGRWINHDPIAEEGGWNLYLSNGITYLSDYIGLNRYITHFDIAGYGGSGTTTLHVGVAVDQWIEKEGKYIKNGIVTYDFAAVLTEKTGFWCSVGNILNCISSIVIAKGKMVSSEGLNLESPITMNSSPCQDIEMLSKLKEDEADPPLYNLIFSSCIIWSSNAAAYGMDKPGIGKCCNPDGTIFKSNE